MASRFNNNLIDWVEGVLSKHDNPSLRAVEKRTGIAYSTVKGLIEGRQANAETIIRFAEAYGESVAEALQTAGYDDIAKMWRERNGAEEMTREPIYDDLPPELQRVYGMHGKVFNAMPPGKVRDKYIESLMADDEAYLAMIETLEKNQD